MGKVFVDLSGAALFAATLRGESTPRPPVWLMRQAGRSDPKYRALRENAGLPLEDLFRNVDYAIEISLLPKRIGVDAIIFFQDILTPLAPMGAEFVFRPGPVLERPIRTEEQIEQLSAFDPSEGLSFVGATLSSLSKQLEGDRALLGFAGAPLTLLYFMVEGKSPGHGENAVKLLRENPKAGHLLLEKLADMTATYLAYQFESGAQCVQLFESVADVVPEDLYLEYALPYQRRVFDSLSGKAPTILFGKGLEDVSRIAQSGADILSLSSCRTLSEFRSELGEEAILQGNVSNRLLMNGTADEVAAAVKECVRSGGGKRHILNLDHGILPKTPWENVETFVRTAQSINSA